MAVTLNIGITTTSQDITANTSSVTIAVDAVSTNGSYNNYGAPGTVEISGNESGTYSFSSPFSKNSTTRIYTKTLTVQHSADGTASLTVKVTYNTNVSAGTVTASRTTVLKPIPRASTPTVSGELQLGSAIVISTNRASSALTHTIKWSWAGHSATIGTGVGESVTWTPSIETMAPYLTDADSAECTITCNTYSGETFLGTTTTTFQLRIPYSVVPVFTSSEITDDTGLLAKFGALVQNKSSITLEAVAQGRYGATINKYYAALEGKTVFDAAGQLDIGAPPVAGTRNIKLTAIDTRGRSISGNKSITVAAYTPPAIAVSAYRVDASTGIEDDESTTIRIEVSGTALDINRAGQNSTHIKIECGPRGGALSTVYDADGTITIDIEQDVTNCPNTTAYDVAVTVTDATGTAVLSTAQVGTATPVLDFKANGKGIAAFGIADEDGFKVYGHLKLAPSEEAAAGLEWSGGGLRGNVRKTLWEGTANPGDTLTIEELYLYNVFIIVYGSNGDACLAVRTNAGGNGSYVTGGSVSTGASTQTINSLRLQSLATNQIRYIYGKATQISASGVGTPANIAITRIEGLL